MKDPFQITMSILVGICMALGSFSLKWTFDANAEQAKAEVRQAAEAKANKLQFEQLQSAIDKLSQQSEIDAHQSKTLAKQWKLHSWARGRINHLEHQAGERPSTWPELDLD